MLHQPVMMGALMPVGAGSCSQKRSHQGLRCWCAEAWWQCHPPLVLARRSSRNWPVLLQLLGNLGLDLVDLGQLGLAHVVQADDVPAKLALHGGLGQLAFSSLTRASVNLGHVAARVGLSPGRRHGRRIRDPDRFLAISSNLPPFFSAAMMALASSPFFQDGWPCILLAGWRQRTCRTRPGSLWRR